MKAPIYNIDLNEFWINPYPDLKIIRNELPICFVPELGATLITKRQDIFDNEKKVKIFSSIQPEGLMQKLMGQNLMRKDGDAHINERKAIFPSISPKTTKTIWKEEFLKIAERILKKLKSRREGDIIRDYAMPLSAEALKIVTGLVNMDFNEMNRVSQGMIEGIANYTGDKKIEENCNNCTKSIDNHIDEIKNYLINNPNNSLLSTQLRFGLNEQQISANIKLAISGGQNEPRDAIAGTVWALLKYPKELYKIQSEKKTWSDGFEEFSRWISPIGMSPRRIAKDYQLKNIEFNKNDKVFLMFGSGNRDEECFELPEEFNVSQDRSKSIIFGAGPHFCAGAYIAKCLIGEVALPNLFLNLPNLELDINSKVEFRGWAFRGPLELRCVW